MLEFELRTRARTDFVDITGQVQQRLADLDLSDDAAGGAVLVFNPHTTAAITINEGADPDVVRDMEQVLDKLVPWSGGYAHAEGNTAAHVKASLYGSSVVVPVENGCLRLGTWQKIWFCEFDGPRTRRVWLQKL